MNVTLRCRAGEYRTTLEQFLADNAGRFDREQTREIHKTIESGWVYRAESAHGGFTLQRA